MTEAERIQAALTGLADPIALLEALFAASPIPLQIYDASGRSILTNAAFRATYGSEPPPAYNVLRDEVAAARGVADLIRRAFAGEVVTTPAHWYDPRELGHVEVREGRRVGQIVTMVPLRDRAGAVSHVAIFAKDVTSEMAEKERADAERARLALIGDLGAALITVLDAVDAARRVAELLVPRFADLCSLLVVDDAGQLVRVSEAGAEPRIASEMRELRTASHVVPEPIARAFGSGELLYFADYLAWVRDRLPADDPYRASIERVQPVDGICAPLRGRDAVIGVLVLGTVRSSGRRFSPDDVALAAVLAERIGVALDNTRLFAAAERARRDAELAADRFAAENRINRTLVELAGAFGRERDERALLRLITTEATALIGAAYGALFFNVEDEAGGTYMLHEIAGADAAAFTSFPMPRATPIFSPTFRGEAPIRSDDITKDPRYGAMGSQPSGHPVVVSYLAVPVVTRDGVVLGGMFFGHPEAGRFTALHERLMVGLASQAAIAMEGVRLYDALRASEARAQAAGRRKDEFLAILGHELRNPLAPIVTAVELMKERRGAEVVERERAVIERQVTHLSRLVDDLLDLSRITSGKVTLARRRLEIADVIAEAVERTSPLFERRGHELTITAPRAGLAVDGDADRLAQILTNLLHNAGKFTPDRGRIAITAARDGDHVTVSVTDDGPGIEAELLPSIFELFVQAPQALNRGGGGLGIGLALARHLVGMHGGTIDAISGGAGRGSTFAIRLPAAAAATPPLTATTPEPLPRSAGKRILVVDDNTDAAETLADVLAECGHTVRVAADGVQAIALARELVPEVAILDIGLPVMDGYELARTLRATLPAPLRLIALTGYGQDSDRERARAAGFDDHLVKPASVAGVLRAVEA